MAGRPTAPRSDADREMLASDDVLHIDAAWSDLLKVSGGVESRL
jgi:hypothetical protein